MRRRIRKTTACRFSHLLCKPDLGLADDTGFLHLALQLQRVQEGPGLVKIVGGPYDQQVVGILRVSKNSHFPEACLGARDEVPIVGWSPGIVALDLVLQEKSSHTGPP